jgi:hypothetical protein
LLDRAKDFYTNVARFRLEVDHRAGDFRVVQLMPPGSACLITLVRNDLAAGSVNGLHLITSDIDAARAELVARSLKALEIFHFDAGEQVPGPDPQRASYGSFFSFGDPDGTGWLVQEVSGSPSSR